MCEQHTDMDRRRLLEEENGSRFVIWTLVNHSISGRMLVDNEFSFVSIAK